MTWWGVPAGKENPGHLSLSRRVPDHGTLILGCLLYTRLLATLMQLQNQIFQYIVYHNLIQKGYNIHLYHITNYHKGKSNAY